MARFVDRPLEALQKFAVILFNADRPQALETASAMRQAIRALNIPRRGVSPGIVTASVGVALVSPSLERSAQGGLQLADQALYEAKRKGRDRVEVLEHEYEALATGVFSAR